ncbi:MAG: 50S ribosomal protein L18 [Alphaproteobacteria bacterium]
MKTARQLFQRRRRIRFKLRRTGKRRPRFSVFRSNRHIYAQIIDDNRSVTLAAASTLDKKLHAELKTGADVNAARRVGELIAERAKAAGVTKVVFDRGGHRFHGRVKALADAAREAGLSL